MGSSSAVSVRAQAPEADALTVDVEAEVPIEWDVATTERRAKHAARRLAIEKVLQEGSPLFNAGLRALTKHSTLLADEIASSAKGVLTEEEWGPLTDGGTTTTKKMKLRARVSPTAIVRSSCAVTKANHDPKITLVLVEKLNDDAPWSMSTLKGGAFMPHVARMFEDACFTIVPLARELHIDEVSASGDLKQSDVDAIVKSSDAQYVLLGSGTPSVGAAGPTGAAARRAVSLGVKLVNTSTNEIEAVAHKSAASDARTAAEALQLIAPQVCEAVLNDVIGKVTRRWEEGPSYSPRVQLILKNVPSLGKAKAVMATFKQVMPTAGITQRDVKGGQATFDIILDGGADRIASELEAKRVGKSDVIEILEVSRGKIIAKLIPAPPRER